MPELRAHRPRTRNHATEATAEHTVSTLPYRRNVGLMVINRDGLVWLGRRVVDPQRQENHATAGNAPVTGGWWQMPQGGIDDGEDPRTAALRELEEETGMRSAHVIAESAHWYSYDLPPDLIGRALGGRYRGQTQKWFLLRFDGDDQDVNITPADHDQEFDIWRWAPLDELPSLIVTFKRDVYLKVIEEFRTSVTPL
jgi:putative (di)nucleoside polyphosphate hydrolase